MRQEDTQLWQFLLDSGLLSRAQLHTVREKEEPLEEVLVQEGYLSEEEMTRALSKSLAIPFISLTAENIEKEALLELPEGLCRTHNFVAYAKDADTLSLAFVDLKSTSILDTLSLSYRTKVHLTDRQSMKRVLLRYQQLLKESYGVQLSADAPTEALVDSLLLHALNQRAHAVHLEPHPKGLLVRYRVCGMLYDALLLPHSRATDIIARLKTIAAIDPHSGTEGKFTIAQADTRERVLIRVSAASTTQGESLVLHLMPEGSRRSGFTLESLGMHGKGLEAVYSALQEHAGLLLVAGPPRSGVTRLLYTLLDLSLRPERKVLTVEDEIETHVPGALQTKEDARQGISLATRLRAALRHDPDVVMVSTLVNPEVAALAVAAASRGTLVIAAMQGHTAAEALHALRSAVSPEALAAVLRVVISTKLVRRLCPHHEPARLTRAHMDELEARGVRFSTVLSAMKEEGKLPSRAQWKDVPFFGPIACTRCTQGYHGFVGVQEVTPMSMTLRDSLLHDEESALRTELVKESPLTELEEGVYKAAMGFTTMEEILRSVV